MQRKRTRLEILQVDERLTITRSRMVARRELAYISGGLIVALAALQSYRIDHIGSRVPATDQVVWLFVAVFSFFLFAIIGSSIYRRWQVSRHGETFTFDRRANTFLHNGKVLSFLNAIDRIELVTTGGGSTLDVILKDGRKMNIDGLAGEKGELFMIGQHIAAHLGCMLVEI